MVLSCFFVGWSLLELAPSALTPPRPGADTKRANVKAAIDELEAKRAMPQLSDADVRSIWRQLLPGGVVHDVLTVPKVPSKMAVDDPTINFQEVDSGYLTLSLRLFCGVGVALADLFHLPGQEKEDGHAKDCCLFLQHVVAALQPQLIVTQSLPSWRAAAQRSELDGAAPGTGAFTAETARQLRATASTWLRLPSPAHTA